jgi:hypothetical protein
MFPVKLIAKKKEKTELRNPQRTVIIIIIIISSGHDKAVIFLVV